MAKRGRGQSNTLRHYFRRDDSRPPERLADTTDCDTIIVAQPTQKKRPLSPDVNSLRSGKSSRGHRSPPPLPRDGWPSRSLARQSSSNSIDTAATPKSQADTAPSASSVPPKVKTSNYGLNKVHSESSSTSQAYENAASKLSDDLEETKAHHSGSSQRDSVADTSRSPTPKFQDGNLNRGQSSGNQPEQSISLKSNSLYFTPIANRSLNRESSEHSSYATAPSRGSSQIHTSIDNEEDAGDTTMKNSYITTASFRSSSSVPTLLSQTPSLPIGYAAKPAILAGQSKEVPLVIPSSQSDADSGEEPVLVIPENEIMENSLVVAENGLSITTSSSDMDDEISQTNENHALAKLSKKYEADSDSESSLEDIFTKPAPKTATQIDTPETHRTLRRSLRSSDKPAHKTDEGLRSSRKPIKLDLPKRTYKYSLKTLINQNKRDAKLQAEIAEVKASLAQLERPESRNSTNNEDLPASGDALANALEDMQNNEDAQKIMQAIDRTGGRQTEVSWNFFDAAAKPSKSPSKSWPAKLKSSNRWVTSFGDSSIRDNAFVTGFAAELFPMSTLPDEILAWVFDAMLCEPSESLSQGYLHALKMYGQLTGFLDVPMLERAFVHIDARPEAVDLKQTIRPVRRVKALEQSCASRGVFRLLRFLEEISTSLSRDTRAYAIGVLVRMSIDAGTQRDSTLRFSLAATLEELVGGISESAENDELHDICVMIFSSFEDVNLQFQLLQGLPASSPLLAKMRRQLALAFVLKDPSILEFTPDTSNATVELDLHERIISLIQTELITVHRSSDYKALTAWILLVDIAIDAGFGRPNFNLEGTHDVSQAEPTQEIDGQIREEEAAFNARVDALSRQVNALFTRIVDGGVTHMQRTEAKGLIETLLYRLDHAVRTKPRPRKRIFGSTGRRFGKLGVHDGDPLVGSLEKFLSKQTVTTTETSQLSV